MAKAKRRYNTGNETRWDKWSKMFDGPISVISPTWAAKRERARFAYDAISGHRTHKKRGKSQGGGDYHLTDQALQDLRDIALDMSRNNPLAIGLLRTERDGVIGTGPQIRAHTGDQNIDDELDRLWKEDCIDQAIDVTGKFNFNRAMRSLYLSYRRDGDAFVLFLDDKVQLIEGEQVGSPAAKQAESFDIVNGVAIDKETKRVLGYYVGKRDKWGWIKPESYKAYPAERMYHLYNPDRISSSRGEPALTQSIVWIDKLCEYMDAELIAARVQACFSVFIARKADYNDTPDPYTGGISSSGYDTDGNRLEKVEPGTIMYGEDGESATALSMNRPGAMFDPFVLRTLMMIGRPLCMPLMNVTLDLAGATFMNARIADQKQQEQWKAEQTCVVTPLASRFWRWKVEQWIRDGRVSRVNDRIYDHTVINRKWPYVDILKEVKAETEQLTNKTTSTPRLIQARGEDPEDILREQIEWEVKVREAREEAGLPEVSVTPEKPGVKKPEPEAEEGEEEENGNKNKE